MFKSGRKRNAYETDHGISCAEELEKFRRLRNTCCHSEPLNWQQENELIQILFAKQEFIKTLVGDAL